MQPYPRDWRDPAAPFSVSHMSASDASARANGNPLLVLGKITSILDAFSLSKPVLQLADIREFTGMPTSTVQRLVTNLTSRLP